MDRRILSEENESKKIIHEAKVYKVEHRADITPEELLLNIRDKIQKILKK